MKRFHAHRVSAFLLAALSLVGLGPGNRYRVVQVLRDGPGERLLANILRQRLANDDRFHVDDLVLRHDQALNDDSLPELLARPAGAPAALILWLNRRDLVQLDCTALHPFQRIYLADGLTGHECPGGASAVRDKLRLVYPYALPGHEPARIFRVRGWLRSRAVPEGDPRAAQYLLCPIRRGSRADARVGEFLARLLDRKH